MESTIGRAPRTATAGRVVAHRGASRVAPENTLAAFRAAAGQGAEWIEFDVSLLGDGTPVIHHDAGFERCTNRTGRLAHASAGDLAGIDAGVRFGDAYRGEPVPTLAATLDLIEALGLSANLEMKAHGDEEEALAGAVAEALARRPWAEARVLVSSFAHATLRHLRARRPRQPVAVLWERLPAGWLETVRALDAASVHLDWRRLRPGALAELRGHGIEVRVYTINDPGRVAGLRDGGLTGVITDHPPLFLERADWAAWAAEPR
ncbi:MAG TPA: glycerophosphodiester phosphodiesterase family protein [Thermohalobaculum sp.]|nr:glycerophosphodiester phosphodiesterase family protein [Thermohalobaculum sp.]